MDSSRTFEHALTCDGVVDRCRITWNASGVITAVEAGVDGPCGGFFALPGMPNAHSHVFQRALVGRGEERHGQDSFWSWRESMYRLANQVTPEQFQVIARHCFGEMLCAGYTSVGEFHYLHHLPDGSRSPAMAQALMAAAAEAGIHLVALPVLYLRGGFDQELTPEQRRFGHDSIEAYLRTVEYFEGFDRGVAPHSLRAVDPSLLDELVENANEVLDADFPVHVHIAEQRREVDECEARYGARPVEVLSRVVALGARWNLVHATHITEGEREAIVRADAQAVICPLTEAYLGDGIFPATRFLHEGGRIAIGSDSNVRLDAAEELRLLEYGQRLKSERRGRLADATGLGAPLWQHAAWNGARALRLAAGELAPGRRADLVVLDRHAKALLGTSGTATLDAWLTAGDGRAVADVYVGGVRRVAGARPVAELPSAEFATTLRALFEED